MQTATTTIMSSSLASIPSKLSLPLVLSTQADDALSSAAAASESSSTTASEPISTPLDTDVLLGRGGGSAKHAGNITFRNLIALHRGLYAGCKKRADKMRIADSILQTIRSRGGRFLELQAASKTWVEVGDKRAKEKTQQALREGQPLIKIKLAEMTTNTSIENGNKKKKHNSKVETTTAATTTSDKPKKKTNGIPTLLANLADTMKPRNTTEALLMKLEEQRHSVPAGAASATVESTTTTKNTDTTKEMIPNPTPPLPPEEEEISAPAAAVATANATATPSRSIPRPPSLGQPQKSTGAKLTRVSSDSLLDSWLRQTSFGSIDAMTKAVEQKTNQQHSDNKTNALLPAKLVRYTSISGSADDSLIGLGSAACSSYSTFMGTRPRVEEATSTSAPTTTSATTMSPSTSSALGSDTNADDGTDIATLVEDVYQPIQKWRKSFTKTVGDGRDVEDLAASALASGDRIATQQTNDDYDKEHSLPGSDLVSGIQTVNSLWRKSFRRSVVFRDDHQQSSGTLSCVLDKILAEDDVDDDDIVDKMFPRKKERRLPERTVSSRELPLLSQPPSTLDFRGTSGGSSVGRHRLPRRASSFGEYGELLQASLRSLPEDGDDDVNGNDKAPAPATAPGPSRPAALTGNKRLRTLTWDEFVGPQSETNTMPTTNLCINATRPTPLHKRKRQESELLDALLLDHDEMGFSTGGDALLGGSFVATMETLKQFQTPQETANKRTRRSK